MRSETYKILYKKRVKINNMNFNAGYIHGMHNQSKIADTGTEVTTIPV